MKDFKLFLVGFLALYLQFFLADYLGVQGSLVNFLLPFSVLCLTVWGLSKRTIWLLFFLGMSYDVININLFGFSAFVLLCMAWLSSKLFLFFNVRSFFSCVLVLLITTALYQVFYYFANFLLVSDSSVGSLAQMVAYFFGSLLTNLLIFTVLGFVYHLRISFYEESR